MHARNLLMGIVLLGLAGASRGADGPPPIIPKPGAPVAAQRVDTGRLAVGVPQALPLRFTGHPDSLLDVEYRPEAGLRLQSPASVRLRTDAQGDAADAPRLEALTEGIHYLNLRITQNGQRRAVSIRLATTAAEAAARKQADQAGAALTPPGESAVTPQGESLIILPASEPPSLESPR